MDQKGLASVTDVMEGIPHREINTYTEENVKKVDLIIMGTHGRTGLDRVLVGSNTEKIVRTSEVPVMTVGRSE
ncbi:universal stress protein uspa-like protein [Candidatus Haloredivivus sp. G17]|nr:universal stress protein uspa-like protein [Candidatus Haloredivivus sp. G17]